MASPERSKLVARAPGIAIAVIFALAALVAVLQLSSSANRVVGTNNESIGAFGVEDHPADKPICLQHQYVAAGTGSLRFFIGDYGAGDTVAKVTIYSGEKPVSTGSKAVVDQTKLQYIPVSPVKKSVQDANVCLTANNKIAIAGNPEGGNPNRLAFVDGKPVGGTISVIYYSQQKYSLWQMVPKVFARASIWGPGWLKSWMFYVFALLLPMIAIGACWWLVRLMRAGELTNKRWIPLVALVVLVNGFTWTVAAPLFQAPDEVGHYAYVESLVLRHALPARGGAASQYGSYGNHQALAVDTATRGIVQNTSAKLPWDKSVYTKWKAQDAALPDLGKRQGGGGTSSSSYSPVYYAPAVVPYLVTQNNSIWTRIWAIRLWSLLLTVGTALFCGLFVRELIPKVSWAAPVAGLIAGFQPMLLDIGTSINNDALMFLCASALLYCFARVMRRGLTTRDAAITGFLMAFSIIVKPTMIGFLPAAGFVGGYALLQLRKEGARLRAPIAAAFSTLLIPLGIFYALLGSSDPTSTIGRASVGAPPTVQSFASYIWQWYLPRLPGMHEFAQPIPGLPVFRTFFQGFFANFNSLDTYFHDGVYYVLLAAMLLLGGGLVAWATREWKNRPNWWVPVAFCALCVLGIIVEVHAYSYMAVISLGEPFAQGRYLLPLVGILGAWVVGGSQGFKRWAPTVAVASVAGLAVLNLFSLTLTLGRFYL